MHEQLSSITIDRMLLNLTGVVRYVVEQRELRIRQDLAEGTTHKMCDDLAIGERAVGGGTHCAQIVLSQFRMNWGAGKFAIRNRPISRFLRPVQAVPKLSGNRTISGLSAEEGSSIARRI